MKNWIPIKHDYLIDNFESLLDSLSDADFGNSNDGYLHESVKMMEEVSKTLLSDYFSHRMGILNEIDDIFLRNVRIVLTSIYSSQRLDRDVAGMLVDLLDSLVVNNLYSDEDSLAKIKDIAVNLSKGNSIESFPYNLRDLATDHFDFPLFKMKLLGFKFGEDREEKVGYESVGSCLIRGKQIEIYPVSYNQISETKYKPILDASLDVKLMSENKKGVRDLDFKEQELFLNHFRQTFKEDKPAGKSLKRYSEDDEFYVKVVNIDPVWGYVKCKTIDPYYQPLVLNLYLLNFVKLNGEVSITNTLLRDMLRPDQVLKVQLIEKGGKQFFSIVSTLKEFFTNLYNFPDTYAAIFLTDYRGGTRWLTEMGHTVNIMDNDWDSEIRDAAHEDCELAIKVAELDSRVDKKGNTVMNAKRVGEILKGEPHDKFREDIPSILMEYIFECWTEDCPEYRTPDQLIPEIPSAYPRLMAHLLCQLSEGSSIAFHQRFYNAFCAKLLSVVTESGHDECYCDFVITYLNALWAFAQDPGHEWLSSPVAVPEALEGVESIANMAKIIDSLSKYKFEHHSVAPVYTKDVDPSRISSLVNASNSLSGNIALSGINRIKRTIIQCLGIGDLYTEEASDKYWFGEETDMLEFKSSIVYPPSKTGEIIADPDIQIWQIIKTVNGFLNSLHGGTLLIGVNDFGNANGLNDDIKWLYQNRKIVAENPDKYLLYIKNRIDHAFEAYTRKDSDSDITAMRVRYSTEYKDEEMIVRIEVAPYEFGCVRIKEKLTLPGKTELKRPDHIMEAYIRTANATEELTPAKRGKIATDKRTVIKDSAQQKQILVQEAIDTSRYLKINGYQSYREKSDKIVEPIELLPLRGLIVGIQKGEEGLRVFKLNRCDSVELCDEEFKPSRHTYAVDPFNMLTEGNESIKMQIRFDRLGWLLIQEIYPYTATSLKEDATDPQFPYLLECQISHLKGIGSFCLSIPGHFKIINCKGLEDYIQAQLQLFPS